MEFREVTRRRRMVRRFDQRPVPPEVLDRLVATALRAPSAGFSQGLELMVLTTPERRKAFWSATTTPDWPGEAARAARPPVIVLPLSDRRAYLDRYAEPDKAGLGMETPAGWPMPYWDLDAAMAVMLLLLAAVDEGLGAWYFGIFAGERELLDSLGVPRGLRPVGAVGLGYPAPGGQPQGSAARRPRRRLEEVVHRDGW